MSRSAILTRPARARMAVARPRPRSASRALRGLLLVLLVLLGLPTLALLGPGFVLDTPQPAPRQSDAIVVISGDEQMARFQEGVNLYRRGYGRYLVFSGAAYDNGVSNADVMRDLALQHGVPDSAILEEPLGEDTWGNAVHTRGLLEAH